MRLKICAICVLLATALTAGARFRSWGAGQADEALMQSPQIVLPRQADTPSTNQQLD